MSLLLVTILHRAVAPDTSQLVLALVLCVVLNEYFSSPPGPSLAAPQYKGHRRQAQACQQQQQQYMDLDLAEQVLLQCAEAEACGTLPDVVFGEWPREVWSQDLLPTLAGPIPAPGIYPMFEPVPTLVVFRCAKVSRRCNSP